MSFQDLMFPPIFYNYSSAFDSPHLLETHVNCHTQALSMSSC